MPKKNNVPDRWCDYRTVGEPIFRTNLIAFKTPLRDSVFAYRPHISPWTPREVMSAVPRLGLVIDLSFAQNPRYEVGDFEKNGIYYEQIRCPGLEIPDSSVVARFAACVDRFFSNPSNRGKLVGVHCTHGVNRTGYVVCRYMIDYMQFEPRVALEQFGRARGHKIERENYLAALLNRSCAVVQ